MGRVIALGFAAIEFQSVVLFGGAHPPVMPTRTRPGAVRIVTPTETTVWGVEAYEHHGETYVLGSDRDSGLWIFRDKRG